MDIAMGATCASGAAFAADDQPAIGRRLAASQINA
jgi:hypothetical protein